MGLDLQGYSVSSVAANDPKPGLWSAAGALSLYWHQAPGAVVTKYSEPNMDLMLLENLALCILFQFVANTKPRINFFPHSHLTLF